MLDLGFLIVLALWSAGVGLFMLRRFGPTPETPADALALAVPIGLGVLALLVLGLGEVGALDTERIEIVLGLGALLAALGLCRMALGLFRRPSDPSPSRGEGEILWSPLPL